MASLQVKAPSINSHVASLSAPPVAVVQQWISSYDGRHGPLIDLSQAVPGYPPHPDMTAALGAAGADADSHHYGHIEGEPVLRKAYAAHLAALYDAAVTADNVMITSGCNQAFITTALTLAGPGDQVLMTNPCYFNHDATLRMLGITTGFVETHAADGFIPALDAIDAAITPRTRALALVNPNNPTGAIIPPDHLQAILERCRHHGIMLILDETYRDFLPAGNATPDPTLGPTPGPAHNLLSSDWQDVLVQLYSFSKSYCIPGHRLGAVLAHPDLIAQMAKVMDNIQICAPRAAQIALAPMIDHLAAWRNANNQEMARRGAAFRAAFDALDDWQITSQGAYFGYVRHPFDMDSLTLAEALCVQAGVLTIPGDFFGTGQGAYLRFAFANADVTMISNLPKRLTLMGT